MKMRKRAKQIEESIGIFSLIMDDAMDRAVAAGKTKPLNKTNKYIRDAKARRASFRRTVESSNRVEGKK